MASAPHPSPSPSTPCTPAPGISIRKDVMRGLLNRLLTKGETWYLIDARWMETWKKYVGYDQWDQSSAGQQTCYPGPVENANLFAYVYGEILNEHLHEELHYTLVPEEAWEKLVGWYGMADDSRPIARKVVEYGMYTKHLKVEVYILKFKLCVYPKLDEHVIEELSRLDTVCDLEAALRRMYVVPANVPCRVWHRYMSDTYELLGDLSRTLQDAGLYNMQTIVLELQNRDHTWPRPPRVSAKRSALHSVLHLRDVSTLSEGEVQSLQQQLLDSLDQSRPKLSQMREELSLVFTTPSLMSPHQKSQLQQYVLRRMRRINVKGGVAPAQTRQLGGDISRAQEAAYDAEARATRAEQATEQLRRQMQALEQSLESREQEMRRASERAAAAETRTTVLQDRLQGLEQELQRASNKATEQQERASNAERQLQQASQRAEAAMSRVRTAENAVTTLQGQLQNTEQQLEQACQRADEQQQRAADAETRLHHSDQVFQDILQRLIGQIPQSQPHWVVQRNEIRLTREELGTGGWASVKVALFRGNRVAAKFLHRQIVSAHNVRLFTREMNMAANARHPNLLQFIGATLDSEEPIILTELMPTSLRRVLEEGTRLTRPQIVSVSRHVALALNYLHLMQPEAVIHRDVSSANVLLEPLPGNTWKAKLSDYGSVNFARHTTTAGPGNPTYAAPEANDPQRQSGKMDVFSFGVLLVEVCSGELAPSEHRDHLLASVQWPAMVALIRLCLRHEPQRRPDMSTVITQLDQLRL